MKCIWCDKEIENPKTSQKYHKDCFKAKEVKRTEKYHKKHKERYDELKRKYYHRNKEKCRERNREWEKRNPERARKRHLKWESKNKDKRSKINKRYYEKNKNKHRIHVLTQYHIPISENQLCEDCKTNKAVERHHPDYSQPFKVLFLCVKCHNKRHRTYP